MTDLHPTAAQALVTLSNLRRLIDGYERALRVPGLQSRVNLDPAARALNFSHYSLATAWNGSLASVQVPLDAPPVTHQTTSGTHQPTSGPLQSASGPERSRKWAYGRHEMD